MAPTRSAQPQHWQHWRRAAAKAKANKPGYRDESTVIGSDKHTQQEEIPEAYKNVSDVIGDLAPYADIAAHGFICVSSFVTHVITVHAIQ